MSIRFKVPVPIRPVWATELSEEGRLQRRDTLVYELVPFSEMVSECDPGDITRVGPCIPPRTMIYPYPGLAAEMDAALERCRQEVHFSRTIRRVETIVNFKDEFGRGERPDWSEFALPQDIWNLPE